MPSRIAIDDPDGCYAWKINQVAKCSICLDLHAPWYEVHHIIKRGRSDEPCNYLLLCERCHRVVEGHRVYDDYFRSYCERLNLANVLWCKHDQHSGEWDQERLAELHCRHLPTPEPLPIWWMKVSARNDRFNVYRKH